MPRVKTFSSFALWLYAKERHRLPHVHIEAPGLRATLAIETGKVMVGFAPDDLVREARAYIAENRAALLEKWKELNP